MSQIQLVGSYEVFEHGSSQGNYDLLIESSRGGSIETITEGTNVITKDLPTGLGDQFTMDRHQAFIALRHMQDRTKSIDGAFGNDIQPRPQGVQVQGVLAMVRPSWVEKCSCRNDEPAIESLAFLLRDGYLLISTLDKEGNWHCDADDVGDAFDGVSAKDIAAIICKVLATIKISGWLWALIAVCTVGSFATGGGAAIACAAGIIALELISIVMLIAIIEEVTGSEARIASISSANSDFCELQFASAKENIKVARKEVHGILTCEFPQPSIGKWLAERVA